METYNGHVRTPQDAIILFEACRIGLLPRVQRRLSEKERQQIKSGSVFVWDEREAGMRRWTDGKSWSASRVSGSFLTYREMEGKRGGNGFAPQGQQPKKPPSKSPDESRDNDSEQDYPEGPDGYRYKPDGLMKQSFSITTSSGQHLHLISYYARSQATAPPLKQPSTDPQLRHIRPAKGMYPEASVNESSNVPAVTRGPMPGSPYAAAPPPGMGSPYSHPGVPHVVYSAYPAGSWPGSPQGTPPTQYYPAYSFYPPGHSPLQHGHPVYPPGAVYAGPYHVQGPTQFDRPPPPLPHTSLPPPPPAGNGYVPPALAAIRSPYPPAQAPPPHPSAALQPSPYANGSVDPGLDPNSRPPNGIPGSVSAPASVPAPAPALATVSAPAPAPATNGVKPPTPPPTTAPVEAARPAEPPAQQSQDATANGTATPAKVIPSIGVLLNNEVHTNGTTDAPKPIDRAGSHSPAGAQLGAGRTIPELKLPLLAEDMRATKALDSVFSKSAGTKV